MKGFESAPSNLERDPSLVRMVYQDMLNAIMVETKDSLVWLNQYEDYLVETVENYQKKNPNFIDDWDDLWKKSAMIKEIKTETEALYEERNRVPGETDDEYQRQEAA